MILMLGSLWSGFTQSSATGQGIVMIQLGLSVMMVAVVISKALQLHRFNGAAKVLSQALENSKDVLDYFVHERRNGETPFESIYFATCDRLMQQLTPEVKTSVMTVNGNGQRTSLSLSENEINLVRATCENTLADQRNVVEHGMGFISIVVAAAPMLGLLGTVWGVLDAFDAMGSAATASLKTLAPSISAALLTTVVGLFVALPGIALHGCLNYKVEMFITLMERFADEVTGMAAKAYEGNA